MRKAKRSSRRGAVLVLFVLCLIALFAFTALAVDLGMLAAARTQAQNAADSAAMAGARTLNGNTTNSANNNYANASPSAVTAATNNNILGGAVKAGEVAVQIGRYTYVPANQRFEGQFPGPNTDNWSLVQATITSPTAGKLAFSKIFTVSPSNVTATATAVHRPRDVSIILDYSGSMRFGSCLGDPAFSINQSGNNGDASFPTFGHYSAVGSAAMQATSFTSPYEPANYSATTSDGRAPIVGDFYTDSSGTLAFTSASAGYATTPGGDNFLKINKNAGATYCTTPADLLNIGSVTNATQDNTWEAQGYKAYGMYAAASKGYTQGPNYYGKTFFVWPPDPTKDWRGLYFDYPGTNTPMDDNSRMWDASGNWKSPSNSNYAVDYTAILNWIKNVGPNPFPNRLQSGRILYYDAIPNSIDTASNPPADMNQRFWKDYIDYVLGFSMQNNGAYLLHTTGNVGITGYGPDYTWGTVRITAKASLTPTNGNLPYMHYLDNPKRPKLHFWFGPLTMIDFMDNISLQQWMSDTDFTRFFFWPGTCHASPIYACKLGIRAALTDIQNNHPNDLVALMMFAVPATSANSSGRFNGPRVGLSRNYSNMQDALWYPYTTIGNPNATIRPYDAANLDVPRAGGGTCYAYPLMMAYNQFSGNATLLNYNAGAAAGDAGGNGRKGAQKIIIFETDGAPNQTASGNFTSAGAYTSYYNVRYNSAGTSEYPSGISGYADNDPTVLNQINAICTQICALDTASPPGYSSTSKKVQIHCIGFGPQFDPSNGNAAACTDTLNQMQLIGNVTDGMPGYKIVYGTEASIVADLQQAIQTILQNGVQVSLIQ